MADKTVWRPVPRSWFKKFPPDYPARKAILAYYEKFPAHRPPIEAWRLAEAEGGDPEMLIAHLQSGHVRGLTRGEIDYLIKLLEPTRGKHYQDRLRAVEAYLVAAQVAHLESEGKKTDAAVDAVAKDRGI